MNLTNPPLTRGLGRTGLLNRRGVVIGTPTTKGLGQTATRAAREPETTGEPLRVTQMVSATDNFVLIAAAETDLVSLSINRRSGSELDINVGGIVSEVFGDDGAGPPFGARLKVYRGVTLVGSTTIPLPAGDHEALAADQYFAGGLFFGLVDDDYISGVVTYKSTVEIIDAVGDPVGGGLHNAGDAYLRVLERRL